MGYPNSGKTTYSSNFENVIHHDDVSKYGYKKYKSGFHYCEDQLRNMDGDVCVEGIYNTIVDRRRILNILKDKNYYKICIWMDTSIEECRRRSKLYRFEPSFVIDHSIDIFQEPTYDEGWDQIIRIQEAADNTAGIH